jgi:CheY-like chemotaxis protein
MHDIQGMMTTPELILPILGLIAVSHWEIKNALQQRADAASGDGLEMPLEPARPRSHKVAPDIENELQLIRHEGLPDLIRQLPADNWHKETWYQRPGRWRFNFECNSPEGRFFASGLGGTPMEAFLITRHRLLAQIHEWHKVRFNEGPALTTVAHRGFGTEAPRVLIVDDDIDMAMAMQTALGQLGCQTEIATGHEGLHRRLVTCDADYIFLDWKLNDSVTADQVMDKAVRYIDTFSDLRQHFTEHRPHIVTHSILDRQQVLLPTGGVSYFNHLDHWQKPMPFQEVVKRASDLLRPGGAMEEV